MAGLTLSEADRDLIRSLIVAEPSLVLDDDDVIRRLVGESGPERNIVDLRDRLVARLESRLEKLSMTHRTVIAAAYENVSGTQQLHRAVLALIEAQDLESFLTVLTRDAAEMLSCDEVVLCLEADVTETMAPSGFGDDLDGRVLAMPQGTIPDYLALSGAPDGPVVLRAAGADAELVFGEANPIQSEACLGLDLGGARGMVVFGSADPRRFDASHGTDLLNFFAGVIERLLLPHLAEAGQG